MKVIMLQDVYKTGVAGEIVDVADGFARNYLIPRGMAKTATKGALKSHEKLMEQAEARRSDYEDMLNGLARKIDGVELIFERRASPTGTLYGSVTTQEIADALLEKTGDVDINRRRISQQAIRELGEFDIPVRLGNEISPMLHVVVVREGEIEEFLRLREQVGEDEVVDIAEMEIVEDLPEIVEDVIVDDSGEVVEIVDESTEVEEETAE